VKGGAYGRNIGKEIIRNGQEIVLNSGKPLVTKGGENTKFAPKGPVKGEMGPKITGIAGAGRSVGATHLALLAANYLQAVRGRKTAVLEWNSHGDFGRLGKMCTGRLRDAGCYQIQDVDYFPQADGSRLAECLTAQYQEILIDFGPMIKEVCIELARCSVVWIVMSFSEWQMDAFWEVVESKEDARRECWKFLTAFGSEESRTEWNKRRKPNVWRIPFSADAFTVTRELMEWMETTLMQDSFSGNVSQRNLLKGMKKRIGYG